MIELPEPAIKAPFTSIALGFTREQMLEQRRLGRLEGLEEALNAVQQEAKNWLAGYSDGYRACEEALSAIRARF